MPSLSRVAQAEELQQLALQQAEVQWPSGARLYAPQWASGIAQAVTDAGTEPLSETRLSELRAAVTQGATERPVRDIPEWYAFMAAAARYNYAALAALPDLTPAQERQLDAQIAALAQQAAAWARRAMEPHAPELAEQAEKAARQEFVTRAAAVRADPSNLSLKRPLTDDEMNALKESLAGKASGLASMKVGRGGQAVKTDEFLNAIVVEARVQVMTQLAATVSGPVYPADVRALQKAYEAALVASRPQPHE